MVSPSTKRNANGQQTYGQVYTSRACQPRHLAPATHKTFKISYKPSPHARCLSPSRSFTRSREPTKLELPHSYRSNPKAGTHHPRQPCRRTIQDIPSKREESQNFNVQNPNIYSTKIVASQILSITIRISRLPTPRITTHVLHAQLRRPSQEFAREFRVRK